MSKDIEFVKIVAGLRKEYLRNKKRLEELKSLIEVDKYKDYYFYVLKSNESIDVCLHLIKYDKTFRDFIKARLIKNYPINLVELDSHGNYKISTVNDVQIKDQKRFDTLVSDLQNDPYINSNFNNISRVTPTSTFRIVSDGIRFDEFNNDDPSSIRYIGIQDVIQCVYYYPLYRPMMTKHALSLLNTKIDRDNISESKLKLIDESGVLDKKVIIDDDIRFDKTPDKSAVLNLNIAEDDRNITLTKNRTM